jgi:glycosyltransferase involved in cell wall biosynthesis
MMRQRFPHSEAFLYRPELASDQGYWVGSGKGWRIPTQIVVSRWRLPVLGQFSITLLFKLLQQPRRTVHLVTSAAKGNLWLIILTKWLFGSRCLFWSDAGFPDTISDERQIKFMRYYLPVYDGAYTAGNLGRRCCLRLGFPDEKIVNAYFSHDVDEFDEFYKARAAKERERIRTELSLAPDTCVLLNISRFLDWKRLEDLAKSIEIAEGMPLKREIALILIGDGNYTEHEEILGRLRNTRVIRVKSVHFPEIKSWYAVADLFVFPSEGDIWGLVVNEALSMRVPVICTKRIGASELVRHGWNGYLVEPRSPQQIASYIAKYVNNRELSEQMRTNAGAIVQTWNTRLGINALEAFLAKG